MGGLGYDGSPLVECKRLVGLPASFAFPVPRTRAYNQLGNAVSPPIVLAIAKQMLKALGK
jgi:DNA (cytosine-5)-methyltransferase 1